MNVEKLRELRERTHSEPVFSLDNGPSNTTPMRSRMRRFCKSFRATSCCLFMLVAISARATQYDVVPPGWITQDSADDGSTAYVFPSLYGSSSAPDLHFTLAQFFLPSNRFPTTPAMFRWSSHSGQHIELSVARGGTQDDVTIAAQSSSTTAIRRLDWEQFHHLQTAFRRWLCRRSVPWIFSECDARFTNLARDLSAIWRDNILASATFRHFSDSYLNITKPRELMYSGSGNVFEKDETRMFATRVVSGQALVVTWGGSSFHPARPGLQGYSRYVSGGVTETRVTADRGLRLFPAGSCELAADSQKDGADPREGPLPIPPTWAPLLSGPTMEFLPIYNLFDLHNTSLLHDRPLDPPACPDGIAVVPPKSPPYLYLLSPAKYRKADVGPGTEGVARFENEARMAFTPNPGNADDRDDINMLARQFLLVGCDSTDPRILEQEWNHILEVAFRSLPNPVPDFPTSNPRCGGYVNGLFVGRSFVEVRNHFSIAGYPVALDAPNLATFAQVFVEHLSAHLDRNRPPGAPPLAEVTRSTAPEPGAQEMQLRFYTTMKRVLDQAYVLEGDDIHAESISEDLH
jgi:hypothetical protein